MSQPSDDTDKISRFLTGLGRIQAGLRLQQSRILAYNESVPVRYEGTDHELKVHTDPEIDLDYYAIELGRLMALAEEVDREFGNPAEIGSARDAFVGIVPNAKAIRNAIIHFDARPRLDNVVWLGGAIRRLHGDGRVEHLVDARYDHHDAAIILADTIGAWLRSRLHAALAAARPAPLDVQIHARTATAPTLNPQAT